MTNIYQSPHMQNQHVDSSRCHQKPCSSVRDEQGRVLPRVQHQRRSRRDHHILFYTWIDTFRFSKGSSNSSISGAYFDGDWNQTRAPYKLITVTEHFRDQKRDKESRFWPTKEAIRYKNDKLISWIKPCKQVPEWTQSHPSCRCWARGVFPWKGKIYRTLHCPHQMPRLAPRAGHQTFSCTGCLRTVHL